MSRSLLVSLVLIAVATLVAASSKKPEGNTCVTWGDPHIWTWDGIMWSTQGAGWYHVLISDKINIQGRFDYGCGGNDVTCIMGFRIFVVNNDNEVHTFEVKTDFLKDNDGQGTPFRKPFRGYNFAYMTYIDGVDAHMVPAVNGGGDPDLVKAGINQLVGTNGGGKVAYFTDNDIYSLNFKFDDIVVQYLHWTLSVTPLTPGGKPNSLFKNVCGFCGTFNSDSDDDFFTRGQQRIAVNWENQDKFAATWKVTSTDAKNGLFRCDGGSSTPAPSATPASPTPVPTSIVTRPPTAPPTGTPTSTPTGTPAPSATPASTPTPTDEPTNPPTEKPTERPTTPPTNTPTGTPTEEPTPAPTPAATTGTVTTGDSTTGGGNGNQTTNITVIVDQFNGTQAFTDANATCCADAFICPGDPLYESCMMDILKTNQTTLAVSASGALVLAGCAKTNITDSSCTQGSLFACPGACNGAGSCVAGKCNCRKGYKNDDKGTCVAAGLTDAQLIAVGVSAGIVAAIVIGAVVFLALAGFGAKKGYDYYHMKDNKMANVNSNPLYNEKKTGGVSPLYAEKA